MTPSSTGYSRRNRLLVALLFSSSSTAMAQTCISLAGSTTCPAFNGSSISTDSTLVGYFPFLAYVSSTAEFDRELKQYVSQGYVEQKYHDILGCSNVNLSNTTNYYARYTTSFICNGIVQNSREPCGVSADDAPPLCADSCASFAESEGQIAMDKQLCSNPSSNFLNQLRADFTNCALPADSLTGSCVTGAQNEPDDCGFASNLQSLCNYCRDSTENATDSCCLTSNATGRCQGVSLPVFSTIPNIFTSTSTTTGTGTASSTSTSTPTGGTSGQNEHHGLSGGAIAGIVIGSIVGLLLLLALFILLFRMCISRKHKGSQNGSILNQPSPQRQGAPPMAFKSSGSPQGYEVLPGGRVAQMSALQGPEEATAAAAAAGLGGAALARHYGSDSDPYGASPESGLKGVGAMGLSKRDASLASSSPHPNDSSPHSDSAGNFSSPEGVASGQSEQLPFFKDYYSDGEIHPSDKVSVLWAYQPRAGDEFELERGDMLKVVGIWDDGWATGVRIGERAEEYDGKHRAQRDSGVSNGSGMRADSPNPSGEIKAFPLVCVCLPDSWRKTVEGDNSTESGSGGGGPPT